MCILEIEHYALQVANDHTGIEVSELGELFLDAVAEHETHVAELCGRFEFHVVIEESTSHRQAHEAVLQAELELELCVERVALVDQCSAHGRRGEVNACLILDLAHQMRVQLVVQCGHEYRRHCAVLVAHCAVKLTVTVQIQQIQKSLSFFRFFFPFSKFLFTKLN